MSTGEISTPFRQRWEFGEVFICEYRRSGKTVQKNARIHCETGNECALTCWLTFIMKVRARYYARGAHNNLRFIRNSITMLRERNTATSTTKGIVPLKFIPSLFSWKRSCLLFCRYKTFTQPLQYFQFLYNDEEKQFLRNYPLRGGWAGFVLNIKRLFIILSLFL